MPHPILARPSVASLGSWRIPMVLLGEAPDRLDHYVRFLPDKESAGPSVVSSHLSGRANTSACGEPVRGGVEVAGNAPAATTAP